MTYATPMTSKGGGDVNQMNVANQGNVSGQSQTGVANAGPAVVDSIGGAAFVAQMGEQMIGQMLSQANLGAAGSGGSDNAHSDTNVAL
jgi:hypothetical protein